MATERITISSTRGKSFTVPYSKEDTLQEVKDKLYEECGVKPHKQTWYWLGYHLDNDEVYFQDLISIGQKDQQVSKNKLFTVVFPLISWKDGSTDKDLDTDMEAFVVLTNTFSMVLIEREEMTKLKLNTKYLALLFPTKRRASSGERHYRANFYCVGQTGRLELLLTEYSDIQYTVKSHKLRLFWDDGTQQELHNSLSQLEFEEQGTNDSFIEAVKNYSDFLTQVTEKLEWSSKELSGVSYLLDPSESTKNKPVYPRGRSGSDGISKELSMTAPPPEIELERIRQGLVQELTEMRRQIKEEETLLHDRLKQAQREMKMRYYRVLGALVVITIFLMSILLGLSEILSINMENDLDVPEGNQKALEQFKALEEELKALEQKLKSQDFKSIQIAKETISRNQDVCKFLCSLIYALWDELPVFAVSLLTSVLSITFITHTESRLLSKLQEMAKVS